MQSTDHGLSRFGSVRPIKKPRQTPAVRWSPATMDTGGDMSGHAQSPSEWVSIPPEILGTVLRLLPCFSDRASLRSVCRLWRAAARLHRPPPPLPLIIRSKFTLSSFSPDGAMSAVLRIPLPEEVAQDDVRCVGCSEGWLMGARPSKYCSDADGECFLLNPFSQAVIRLPSPCAFNFFGHIYNSVPISNGSGEVTYAIRSREYAMLLSHVVLSASLDSSSECIIAALSERRAEPKLALWQPGMTSWCVCVGTCITRSADILFYQGTLYMLFMFSTKLHAFQLGKHDDGTPVISHVERCMTEPLPPPPSDNRGGMRSNLVEWHGKLLLVIRYFKVDKIWHQICRVDVFVLDFSTNPYGCKEIKSLDGESIFISPCCSKSFPACQYDGVEDDHIYFIDELINPYGDDNSFDAYVYDIRDGTIGPFTVGGPEENPVQPRWFFLSE